MTKKILTIGAYERDNFGDLLFFIVLEKALAGSDFSITAGSTMFSDMRQLLGRFVYPYDLLLTKYKWDVVWVVGGEMGCVDSFSAIKMSLSKSFFEKISKLQSKYQHVAFDYFTGIYGENLAYLPDLKKYHQNKDSIFIVNSVGGFEFFNDHNNAVISGKNKSILASLDFLSVRNRKTLKFLDSIGIGSDFAPDIVHVMPIFYKSEKSIKRREGKYFLFQINEELLGRYGTERVSDLLLKLVEKYSCKVGLFAAGIASFHDNMDGYVDLVKCLGSKKMKDEIFIIEDRDPLVLVDWIIHSEIWIGSSLHGRILSAAYSVPRISLRVGKVTEYASYWDPEFPLDVSLEDIQDSCEKAFSVDKERMDFLSKNLCFKARENLDNILKKIV